MRGNIKLGKLGFVFLTTTLLMLGISPKTHSQGGKAGLCMRHTRISGSSGNVVDTGWVCAREADFSEWIGLGDDTGWKDQELAFRTIGGVKVCLFHSRVSGSTGGRIEESKCSESYNKIERVNLGDDTGWKNQRLGFTVYSPEKNYEICLQHRRRSGSSGNVINTGWVCSHEKYINDIYLGDDTGWRDQILRFKINKNR